MPTDNVVKLDSRKFLGAINNSAQAKIAFFEDRLQKMGQSADKNWQLVALRDQDLFFEDRDNNQFYLADHSTDHGKVNINNIRPVQIFEKEKREVFEDACGKLVDAIEENDQRGMQAMFNTMKKHRFSGRSIPHSGVIRCRDGVIRHVPVATESIIEQEARPKLIRAIVEGLQDRVIVENGAVVSANFNDGSPVKLPVTKWATRKLVAKRMRDTAANAFWSEGFQRRVAQTASLVAEGKIDEAVKFISPFLDEMEEFTLLNREQSQTLVENALATQAIFNQQLCDDTATLFYRTNLRVNRDKILSEWKNIARRTEHPVLAENVQVLRETKNFEAAYDRFLGLIFEAISNREVAAEALASTLEVLKDKTPRIKESHDLSSKLNGLIDRLQDPNFDDAAIYEAEDLIATIQEELAANESLSNFDQMPGDSGQGNLSQELTAGLDQDAFGEPPEDGAQSPQSDAPVVNINSPLIQIGGNGQGDLGQGGEEDLGDLDELTDLAGEEEPEGIESDEDSEGVGDKGLGLDREQTDELSDILGGHGGAGALGESKRRRSLRESRPNHYEMRDEGDDDWAVGPDDRKDVEDSEDIEESDDPYAFKQEPQLAESRLLTDYGAPVINDDHDMQKVVQIMHRLAKEHNLGGNQLQENVGDLAKAGIRAIGLRIPQGRMNRAVEQVVSVFNEEKPFPGAAPPFGSEGEEGEEDEDLEECDENMEECEDDMSEDQLKGPRIPGRGYQRSSVNPLTRKVIKWGTQQEDAIAGSMRGVNFILDHGGPSANLPPVILSEDGSVEIPVPGKLHNEALAAAGLVEGGSDGFKSWLAGSLEQLRPVSEDENKALEEAMAKIQVGPDGEISVDVTDDVEVGDVEGGEIEGGEEDLDAMAPVDSVDIDSEPEDTGEEEGDEDAMPDFEAGEVVDVPDDLPPGDSDSPEKVDDTEGDEVYDQGEEEEEEPAFEDKDITDPKSSGYTKHTGENKRSNASAKYPKASDDELEEVGPDLKKDDGSGTKPPTARKASKA